ncbi:hypothetical protein IZ6_23390 [Terrihabitans soli]|uniref:Activator of Hsp90 ATPase homologue 1/2-like C-terminal domain-containing protein n=1 Tax=Terrihabitans soli TaxID=708113 RepID=A0A6S6QMC6_9HYPH|nr:SRPBCC family protein [Terrihabitans soli]BCJ91604.1 hypothetical protein IZ6_23390 [Terrihabitans soli]
MSEYVTDIAPDTVRLERSLPGPIERVWSYITDSDKRQTWLARGPIDQNEGGTVELTWENDKLSNDSDDDAPENFKGGKTHTMRGRVLACEPPRLLSFTWPGDKGESQVTFELTPKGDRVHLVLTHSRLASRDGKIGVSGGWHAHIGILEDILEGRKTRPFWKNFNRLHAEYKTRL